jgi:hypothetical protein
MGDETIITEFSEHSTASGALISFAFITDNGGVDFSKSFLLALDRNTSFNHTLSSDPYPGHYRVYVYDIEHDGALANGVGYPAVIDEFHSAVMVGNNDQGTLLCKSHRINQVKALILWGEVSN